MEQRMKDSLDRYITGNYGEDQFKEERDLPDCSYECYAGDCKKCDGIGCDCLCHNKR